MDRRRLIMALLGAPLAIGAAASLAPAEAALPVAAIETAEAEPAFLLGRSLHRMRRMARRRRYYRGRRVRRRRRW